MEIPIYKDVVELYNKGQLQRPENDYIYYHLNEERKALGNKYVIHDNWNNFVAGIKLSKDAENKFWEKLWKINN